MTASEQQIRAAEQTLLSLPGWCLVEGLVECKPGYCVDDELKELRDGKVDNEQEIERLEVAAKEAEKVAIDHSTEIRDLRDRIVDLERDNEELRDRLGE